jgi:plasmid maintenance system killer protein
VVVQLLSKTWPSVLKFCSPTATAMGLACTCCPESFLRSAHRLAKDVFLPMIRLRIILGSLNSATRPKDMNPPGLKIHELSRRKKGIWLVWVCGNWRVTFRFEGKHAEAVDDADYQ